MEGQGTSASAAQARTGRTILVEWANAQGDWVRTIVAEVLASRRPLGDERLGRLYEQFLVEKELRDGEPITVRPLESVTPPADTAERLTLEKLDDIENVNALTAGQAIEFNAGLTIIFGKNGAGKSGYVRVLKRAARVRSVEQVLPNILAAQRPQGGQRARITYRLGDEERAVDWRGDEGVPPLTRLDVFDARAIALHVDEDLTYVYTPSDLALFGYVTAAIEGIRARLDAETKANASGKNHFLPRFARDARLYSKIESLGAATDIRELEGLAVVTKEEADGVPGLRERVNALRPEPSSTRVLQVDADRALLERALTTCGVLARFDPIRYQQAILDLANAEAKYHAATEVAFAGLDVPGALGEAWRGFVLAGDAYRASAGLTAYPTSADKCLYCRQDLAATALELLQKYKDYCNNQLKRDVDAGRAQRTAIVREVVESDVGPLAAELERRHRLAQADLPYIVRGISALVSVTRAVQDAAQLGIAIETSTYTSLLADLEPKLRAQLADAELLLRTLRGQADERKREHEKATAQLREIEARLVLAELLPDIRSFVHQARWANKAQTLATRFRRLFTSLTEAAKEASEGLLNQDFERRFRAECDLLRAPTVRLAFPGRKGQPARRKHLATEYRLSDILSEGEQKVIALADFLAEAQLKASPDPIVFDDPVTSLDYERMVEVVDRIARLSASRQVIVFTHNIWFAIELVNRFGGEPERCSYFDIAQDGGRIGIVTGGANPRADSVKTISRRINSTIQEARAARGEAQAALIESGYEHVRSWCEVVVETELLQKVVQRYQPNVMMGALKKIKPQALGPAIKAITPIFDKACRFIRGHSQPLETLNVRPTLADLEKDWAEIQAALQAYGHAVP